MSAYLQLQITLSGIQPPIWRRIIIEDSSTFEQLHHTIQLAMGWTNSHLHEFAIQEVKITHLVEQRELEQEEEMLHSPLHLLKDFIDRPGIRFIYLYDYGDFWMHSIEVEKILTTDEHTFYPVCVDGERACPPEDCGGLPGYSAMLQSFATKDEEYEDLLERLGGSYDPEAFDKEATNKSLKNLSGYMKKLKKLRGY